MTVTIGRGELLAALDGAAVAWPFVARAAAGDAGDRASRCDNGARIRGAPRGVPLRRTIMAAIRVDRMLIF
jgi:hypothetical protein